MYWNFNKLKVLQAYNIKKLRNTCPTDLPADLLINFLRILINWPIRLSTCPYMHMYLRFWSPHVFLLKQKLSVEITHVDRVEINLETSLQTLPNVPLSDTHTRPLTTSILENPVNTRFFNSSHPIPPAPTTNTLADDTLCRKSCCNTSRTRDTLSLPAIFLSSSKIDWNVRQQHAHAHLDQESARRVWHREAWNTAGPYLERIQYRVDVYFIT